MGIKSFFKIPKFRSPAFRKWIRTLPCLMCKILNKSECAHKRKGNDGAMAMKPSDKNSVPLCNTCHRKQHDIGEKAFWGNKIDKVDDVADKLFDLWEEDEHERDATAYELIARWR